MDASKHTITTIYERSYKIDNICNTNGWYSTFDTSDIALNILSILLSQLKFSFEARSLFINVTFDPLSSKTLVSTNLFSFLMITGTTCFVKGISIIDTCSWIPKLAVLGVEFPVLGSALTILSVSVIASFLVKVTEYLVDVSR